MRLHQPVPHQILGLATILEGTSESRDALVVLSGFATCGSVGKCEYFLSGPSDDERPERAVMLAPVPLAKIGKAGAPVVSHRDHHDGEGVDGCRKH